MPHPFRFAVQVSGAASATEWRDKARRVEALGYDRLLVSDHFERGLAALPALAAAAAATDQLRVGSYVLANDFRHPVLLAKEAATLDLLSDGRFELGLGAGWLRAEYDAAGVPFDAAPTRIARLEEALRLLKRLFAGGPVSFTGDHYRTTALELAPAPVQRPHPPILVGGGGRRLLEVAARQADIVALGPRALPSGTLDPASISAAATAEKVAWIRAEADARARAHDLELNVFVYALELTDAPPATAERLAADFALPAPEVAGSPHVLIGSLDGLADQLQERRERYGISLVTVTEELMERGAPLVARLAGRR